MSRVLESKYRPSRKLLEHTAAMIKAQSDFVLLDEQRVAFESVLAEARAGYHDAKKSVVLVQGGPGTGKSIIALHLVGELAKRGYNAMHATGSKAFTENMRRVVGSRAGQSQFRYFNQFGNADANDVDVLILDEAHRLRETSASRFTPKAKRTDIPQVDELIQAAKTTVFFIDDYQTVRPNEVGSTQRILEAAERNGADVSTFELETQFRLAGSKAFLQWVDGMLGLTPESANPTWDPDRETFDFRIVDSVEQLDALIRSKADEGHSARLTAGFCWPWSNPNADGTLVNDVKVGAWQMPWNARPDAGRLAPGIPPSNFWASRPQRHRPGRLRLHRPGLRVRLRRRHLGPRPALGSRHQRLDRRLQRVPRLHRQALRRPLHRPRQAHLPRPPHPRPQGLLRVLRGSTDSVVAPKARRDWKETFRGLSQSIERGDAWQRLTRSSSNCSRS